MINISAATFPTNSAPKKAWPRGGNVTPGHLSKQKPRVFFHGTSLGLLQLDKRVTLKKKWPPPGIDGDSFTHAGPFLHCTLPAAFVTHIPLLVWSQALGCQLQTSFSWIKCMFIPSRACVPGPTAGPSAQLNETID